jgi:hypothetical protein
MRWGEWREHLELLPEHMHQAIVEWIEQGEPRPDMMGSFLHAILTNDLMEAFARADFQNTVSMRDWVAFLQNFAPIGSYGSEANLLAWYAAQHAPPTPEEPAP